MATAEAVVCNLALLRIGAGQRLTSLEDANPIGRACSDVFDLNRDAVLEAAPWPFAMYRADLAAITDGERTGWAYAYQLPTNCLAPRYITDGTTEPAEGEEIPFVLEADATNGRVLLTNQDAAELVYTARVEAVGRWSPMFKQALAFLIAYDLANGIMKKPTVAREMMSLHVMSLRAAAAAGFNQRKKAVDPVSSAFENSRGG